MELAEQHVQLGQLTQLDRVQLARTVLRKKLSAARRTNKQAREAAGLEMRAPNPGRLIENEAEMTPAELRDELKQIVDDNEALTRRAIECARELANERAIERRRSPRYKVIGMLCVISFSLGLAFYHFVFTRDCDEQQSGDGDSWDRDKSVRDQQHHDQQQLHDA